MVLEKASVLGGAQSALFVRAARFHQTRPCSRFRGFDRSVASESVNWWRPAFDRAMVTRGPLLPDLLAMAEY